jgi:filamentous hemagglutinin family protein
MKAASLNHVYRLVWSKVQQAWVAVAETTRAHGKSSVNGQVSEAKAPATGGILDASFASSTKWRFVVASAFAAAIMPFSSMADTNVVAGVVAGDLTVKDINSTHTQYIHTANVNIVDFYKFGVMKGHQLDVIMPDAGRALYRVIGNSRSEIMGTLNSNGSLFLINQNGILFGKGSEVNVGNIVASTLNISNEAFLQGNYKFTATDQVGDIKNQGVIKTQGDGYIVMLGKKVVNTGTLVANNGSVVLASAKEAVLDFYGNGLVRANLTAQAVEGLVKNSGLIQANGGLVQLATNARSAAINISGIVEANQLVERDGMIRLEGGDNAKVQVTGQLIAKGENTTGGTIEVTGEQVALLNGAVLDASGDNGGGKILVGGDYQGKNDAVYNSRTTYVAEGVTMKADALQQGNGGKVIVWADDLTRYYGSISAQGGAISGNGGFVEVSGKQNLAFIGKVNVGAENGIGGTVLLDPENIVLDSSTQPSPTNNADGTPDVAFADNAGGTTTIQVSDVVGFSELFLQANNNITVNTALAMNTNGSIRFEANNDINVNAALTTTGTGSINLKADADNSGVGNLAIGADIKGAGGVVLSSATLTHTAGNISSNGDIYGFGHAGSVSITVAGSADLGTANITAMGRNASSTTGGFNGGSVNIQAGSLNMTGNINTSGSAAGNPTLQGGQGGAVTIATTGDAKVGNITTGAGNAGNASTVSRVSGEVNVGSTTGNVTIGDISTKGGFNAIGADVNLNAANGSVNVGNINTSGGAGRINTDGKSAGNVDITAGNGITTQSIVASGADGNGTNKSGGAAGDATLNAKAGDINLGPVTVKAGLNTGTGVAGNAGAILAEAGNNLNVIGAVSNDKGSVTLKADADNSGTGNLAIGANITGPGNVILSGATLTHTAGDISSSGNIFGFGHAGSVNITVTGLADLGTANITANGRSASSTTAGFNGGSVVINAGSLNMTGNINTAGSAAGNPTLYGGQGGTVTVATTGDAKLGNITTGAGNAGNSSTISRVSGEVKVTSTAGDVTVGDVTTKGGFNSIGAKVTLSAVNGDVTTGNIDTSGGAGRNNTDGKSAGAVDIAAGTGITTQTIVANGADGNGTNKSGGAAGDVTLKTTAGDINLGAVTVQSGAKTGTGIAGNTAKVLAQAGQDVHLNGNISSNSNAADAVQLVAGRNFINSSNSSITTGATGRWTIYSADPTGDVKGSNLLATYDYKQYGTAFGGVLLGTGNGFVHQVSPTVTATLNGTSTKVFDGNNTVTDLSGLTVATSGTIDGDVVTVSPVTGATFNDALVGAGKPITGTYNVVNVVTAEGKQIFNPTVGTVDGYNVSINSTATGSITALPVTPTGFASPRDDAGLGGLIPNNPILNTMFIVSLNPAAGDEDDLDAVACPTPEDHLGSTPILSSGVKLPDGVNSNCI